LLALSLLSLQPFVVTANAAFAAAAAASRQTIKRLFTAAGSKSIFRTDSHLSLSLMLRGE